MIIHLSAEPGGYFATDSEMEQMGKILGYSVVYSEYSSRESASPEGCEENRAAFFRTEGSNILLSSRRLLQFRSSEALQDLIDWQAKIPHARHGGLRALRRVFIPDGMPFKITLQQGIETAVEAHRIWTYDGEHKA